MKRCLLGESNESNWIEKASPSWVQRINWIDWYCRKIHLSKMKRIIVQIEKILSAITRTSGLTYFCCFQVKNLKNIYIFIWYVKIDRKTFCILLFLEWMFYVGAPLSIRHHLSKFNLRPCEVNVNHLEGFSRGTVNSLLFTSTRPLSQFELI